ncbi:MAG: DUF1028 domain-containing protein [Candidatus Dormibacteria bacterium]
MSTSMPIATFSIAATDGTDWGVAVASKFLAVGSAVPAAAAGVGAIATQAMANTAYRPDGLRWLNQDLPASEVVAALTGADPEREHRQLGVVDRAGGAATYTGSACFSWAGGRTGPGCACQGNILAGPEVVDAMIADFAASHGGLTGRLLGALLAGDAAGGDRRGRQSAAILVVRAGQGTVASMTAWSTSGSTTTLNRSRSSSAWWSCGGCTSKHRTPTRCCHSTTSCWSGCGGA